MLSNENEKRVMEDLTVALSPKTDTAVRPLREAALSFDSLEPLRKSAVPVTRKTPDMPLANEYVSRDKDWIAAAMIVTMTYDEFVSMMDGVEARMRVIREKRIEQQLPELDGFTVGCRAFQEWAREKINTCPL